METPEQKSVRMKEFWEKRRQEKEAHRLELKKIVAEKEAAKETEMSKPVETPKPIETPTPTISTIVEVQAPVKKATTTPWRPAKRLNIPEELKDPRFVYRFVNTKRDGNEVKKRDEGWEYDTELSAKLKARGLESIRSLEDGTPLDSHYRIRELIVMRMPKEMAASRNKYYQDKTKVDTARMKQGMRTQMGVEGATQEAGVYADSYGLAGFNKEGKEEIFRR